MDIDFKLIRLQMAAMCLKQHQEQENELANATIYHAWFETPDNYLYVTYKIPVVEDGKSLKIKQTFKYFISPEDGTLKDVQMIRAYEYEVVNPEQMKIY